MPLKKKLNTGPGRKMSDIVKEIMNPGKDKKRKKRNDHPNTSRCIQYICCGEEKMLLYCLFGLKDLTSVCPCKRSFLAKLSALD